MPTTAFAFSGGNIIENCQIYNPSGIFSSRDIGDLFGEIVMQNLTVHADRQVSLMYLSASQNFDYAHAVRVPDKVVLENIRKTGTDGFRFNSDLDKRPESPKFEVMMRNVEPIASITCGSPMVFDSCLFKDAKFQLGEAQFRFCTFDGSSSALRSLFRRSQRQTAIHHFERRTPCSANYPMNSPPLTPHNHVRAGADGKLDVGRAEALLQGCSRSASTACGLCALYRQRCRAGAIPGRQRGSLSVQHSPASSAFALSTPMTQPLRWLKSNIALSNAKWPG